MRPGYSSQLARPTLPDHLRGRVLAALESHRRRTARIHSGIWTLLGLTSLAVAGLSLQSAWGQMIQSGFGYYFALMFSDVGALAASWKELLLTLAESMPLLGLTIFLAALWTLLESVKGILSNYRNMSLPVRFAK
jgi:hypothetical protein